MNNELYHHGILGMKWGVRRYQNADGSLTPAGKKRAAKLKAQYTDLTNKQLRRASGQTATSNAAPSRRKRISKMTDEELKNAVTRLQMEKMYSDLENQLYSSRTAPKTKGQKFMEGVKDVAVPVLKNSTRDAGQKIATEWLTKVGKDLAGLNDSDAQDVTKAIKKDIDRLKSTKERYELQQYVDEIKAATKEGRDVDFDKIDRKLGKKKKQNNGSGD